MEIKKEAIDIHYHYDIVRMVASQGCKFVTKVRREDFEYYNFTDEEWNSEFPMKYTNFKSADILVITKPDEKSPRRGFANPYRKDGLSETDITEDEIDEWEEVSIEECNRRRELSLELDNNWENCKGGGHLDRFGYWTKD